MLSTDYDDEVTKLPFAFLCQIFRQFYYVFLPPVNILVKNVKDDENSDEQVSVDYLDTNDHEPDGV